MGSKFRLQSVLVLTGILAATLSGPAALAANLTVQVLERGSGTPIAGAAVCLGTGADPSQFGAYRSDGEGKVSFQDVVDAPLVLTISKSGFRGEQRNLLGTRSDRVLSVLLPRGGLGPQCDAPAASSDETGLSVLDFQLDGGDVRTRNRTVRLNFRALGGATHYRASESQDFAHAQWQPLRATPTFELSPGAGIKRVYLQLRKLRQSEGLSLETRSDVVSDTIELSR